MRGERTWITLYLTYAALAFCSKASFRPEVAMFLLDESLAISNELGMRPLMEWVLSRRDILKA